MEQPLLEQKTPDSSMGRVWLETKKLWTTAFPTMLARVGFFGILVVTQAFIGQISELDLAAYALVQTITVRFVNGILLGMSSVTETLCGQAFGAKQYHMLGIYLQRSWVINLVVAVLLLPLFILGAPIFRLLGQQEDISVAAGRISFWFIPILFYSVFSNTNQMFLQGQLKNMIVGWLASFSFVFHVLLSWLFVSHWKWGITGAMAAMNISCWLMMIGQLVYITGGWCPLTWCGFTTSAFSDLAPVIRMSISSGVMLCLELWYNAVLVLLAGYMKNAEIAISAFSICLNINSWIFRISLGFLGAACVRVSNELGRGDAKAAKFSIVVVSCNSLVVGVIFFVICLAFGDEISYLFTNNAEIAKTVSNLSLLLALSVLLNSIQPVLSGVAVGAGMQSIVAYVNIGSYYVIGVPAGVLLGYLTPLKVKGIWIGMMGGVAIQSLVLGFITWRTDWDHQVTKASERLNKWLLKQSGEENRTEQEG
uniref:Protein DETOXIFICATION n=1 Tax=Kalanchoe fedtschenkoi TaxID=63787 RepID=A0A7N0RBY4_KALFE